MEILVLTTVAATVTTTSTTASPCLSGGAPGKQSGADSNYQGVVSATEAQPTTTSREDLKPEQKEVWKDRLGKSGHWAEEYGETIFKGTCSGPGL